MDFDSLLPVLIAAMIVVYPVAALAALRRMRPTRRTRNVILTLVAVEIALVLLQVAAWRDDVSPAVAYFVDMDQEFTLPAIVSALQLALIALTALAIAVTAQPLGRTARWYFVLVAAVFAYLAADEYHLLHEELGGTGNLWRVPYAVAGVAFLLVGVAVFRRAMPGYGRFFAGFFGGLGLFIGSAAATEPIIWTLIAGRMVRYQRYTIFEETLEMVGVTLALAAILILADEVVPASRRRWARALAGVGGLAALAWMLFYIWGLPWLEWRAAAQRLENTFDGGALSLVGYWAPREAMLPGQTVKVYLYWRANEAIARDYHLSVHALAHPDIETVAQSDVLLPGEYPSVAWLPGAIVRGAVTLRLPEDLPVPASYWLTARLWTGDWTAGWENTRGVLIDWADRPFIAPDTLRLGSLVVLSTVSPPEPPVAADYRFGDGFRLAGYALPDHAEAGGTLEVRFWWHAEREIDSHLVQFTHLLDDSGALAAGFDGPPFGGAFPTDDWPGGMRAVDTWTLALPDDVPAGEYTVRTGMYAPDTLARAQVSAGNGEPLNDNSIVLGRLRVGE